MTSSPLIGAHISVAGGLHKVFARGSEIGASTLQMFTKSNRRWFGKPLEKEQIEAFQSEWETSDIKEVVVHAAYLINIGSKDEIVAEKSTKALREEVLRCEQLNIKYLVVHPGAYTTGDEETCILQIAKSLEAVLDSTHKTSIVLETMAGQGTTLGKTFEQLAAIRDKVSQSDRVGICLDTCHIFSAGYDLRTASSYEATMSRFDEILGFETLKVLHVNDSKTPFNSRKDRHEKIGKGSIPLETFEMLMKDERFADVPKILETPSTTAGYAKEIGLLKSFAE